MTDGIASHTAKIEIWPMVLSKACKARIGHLTTADLATIDEFHIHGRKATPKLAARDVTDLTIQGSIDPCKKISHLGVKRLGVLQVHEMASAFSSPNYG